jgi:DNA-binding NarL/FixJ family response regulator
LSKISILIAEDHKLIRETWTLLLNEDPRFVVIASCDNAEKVVQLVKALHPDVTLMDINMHPFSGMEATQLITRELPDAKIIGVSMYSKPAFAIKMFQMGAKGYVTKNSSKEEMFSAIIEVYNGKKYVCEEIRHLISGNPGDEKNGADISISLTEREMQIIDLVKEGSSSRQIALSLQISLKTVEVHRHNILKKLKLKNSASLVNYINTNPSFI